MNNIKSILSLSEVNAIVNSVVNACFVDGEYRPENKISAEKLSKIIVCTDYFDNSDIEDYSLEFFYEKFFMDDEFISLVREIDTELNSIQNNEIKMAINEAIEYRKNILYKTSAYSETDMALSSLVAKLEEIVSKLGENISEETIDKAVKFLTNFSESKENLSASKIIDTLISKKVIDKEYKEVKKSNKTISKTK